MKEIQKSQFQNQAREIQNPNLQIPKPVLFCFAVQKNRPDYPKRFDESIWGGGEKKFWNLEFL